MKAVGGFEELVEVHAEHASKVWAWLRTCDDRPMEQNSSENTIVSENGTPLFENDQNLFKKSEMSEYFLMIVPKEKEDKQKKATLSNSSSSSNDTVPSFRHRE